METIDIAEIKIDYDKAIAESIKLREKISEVKSQMKELKKNGNENTAEFIKLSMNLKDYNEDLRINENNLRLSIKTDNTKLGTLQILERQNSALRAEQKKLDLMNVEGIERNEEIVAQIEKNITSMEKLKDRQAVGLQFVGQYSKATEGLNLALKNTPFGQTINGFKGVGKQMWALVTNPLGLIIAGIVGAFTALYNIFKNFTPVADKISQIFAGLGATLDFLKNKIVGLFTAQEKSNQTMREAYQLAIQLKKAEQELANSKKVQSVEDAKRQNQIKKLLAQSKDLSRSESERVELINKALEIEEKSHSEKVELANEDVRIAMMKIVNARNFTEEEVKLLKQKGVAYAIELQNTKNIASAEIDALAEALKNREQIESQTISLTERAIAEKNNLIQKEAENERKQLELIEKEREKRHQANLKRIEAELEASRKLAEQKLNDLKNEIEIYKILHGTKIEDKKALTKNEVENEKARLELIYNMELAHLESLNLSKSEYALRSLQLSENLKNEQARIDSDYDLQQKALELERIESDFNNRYEIAERHIFQKLELEKERLAEQRLLELENAERTGADVTLINQKYADAEKEIEREKAMAKFEIASALSGSVAQLFNENTKIGKAAAVADTAINTIKGAFAAYTGMVETMPGPVGIIAGGIASAGVVASGAKSISKILAIKPNSTSVSAPSFSAPTSVSTPTNVTETQRDLRVGAGFVGREVSGSQNEQKSTQIAVVVDDVTARQSSQNMINTASMI